MEQFGQEGRKACAALVNMGGSGIAKELKEMLSSRRGEEADEIIELNSAVGTLVSDEGGDSGDIS